MSKQRAPIPMRPPSPPLPPLIKAALDRIFASRRAGIVKRETEIREECARMSSRVKSAGAALAAASWLIEAEGEVRGYRQAMEEIETMLEGWTAESGEESEIV